MTGQGWAEPLAIVAIGCRYAGGVGSPEDLWQVLVDGRDVMSGFPADRGWHLEAGRSYVDRGGFLADAAGFDAAFFGVSPREALAMDPQQRQLLEVAWEVLERAGIDPAAVRGSRTGVFVGAEPRAYGPRLPEAPDGLAGYLLTGTTTSVASGRIAYTLGLSGPVLTVDTSASSSLVAVHLAAQALHNRECALALAGGVNILTDPGNFVAFSGLRGLAPDGRCKPFSDAADGTAWSEGVGMIALERLSDAVRAGHPVLAVLRGSAVNNDGASDGLTAPSGPAQREVIRQALAVAGLAPGDIDAVEAHGTGTRLGDRTEAGTVLEVYGPDRPADRPLRLGSVKSNLGHTLAAAGVAGIIKTVLALRHGELPRTLHAEQPTTQVDWAAGHVKLLSEPVAWPSEEGRVRRAGVSSFGISGTNAHVIIEEAPSVELASQDAAGAVVPAVPVVAGTVIAGTMAPWVVSGRSEDALRGQADRLREFTATRSELDPRDVAWSLAATRSAFERRAVVFGEKARGLDALAAGLPDTDVVTGSVSPAGLGRTVFVFPGQGAQWVGMGRELMLASPVFAARMGECAAALSGFVDWSLLDVLEDPDPEALEAVDVVQPVLWAVMVSLAELWRAAGVVPDAVVGHSQGEIAAAVVAGGLSLEDGARVVALRSRAIRALAGHGGMVSVAESVEAVRARIGRFGDRVSVAVVNSLEATVVSGEIAALEELVAECEAEGVRVRRLPVDYASHSAQVEEIRGEILSLLAPVSPSVLQVPMLSAMSGRWLEALDLGAGYWFASLRATVEFDRAVRVLADAGHGVFLEMSPHPVLTGPVGATLEDAGVAAPVVVGSLRRDEGGVGRVLTSFAEAWVRGVPVDWAAVIGSGERVDLPTYAFQHEQFWLTPTESAHEAVWLRAPQPRTDEPARPVLDGDPLALVLAHAAAVLGHASVDALDPERTFKELGFDSVTGVELRNRLTDATALALPQSLVFDRPTPRSVAAYLRTLTDGTSAQAAYQPVRTAAVADEPVAIVALACRFPGGVSTPEEYWRLLAEGRDAVGAFPGDRGWDIPETPHAHAGGFLPEATLFDPAFFGISPREALSMDPQQRLLLETSWEALERAGLDPVALRGSQTGVFVGATVSGYGADAGQGAHVDGHLITGTAASVMSGRIAYTLGLEGPAVTVDTACSSSLVALHLAGQSLRSGECALALVGGVSVMTTPAWFLWFSRQSALASDGRSKAFSASADGMGMAEGAGMIVLERLSDAERNGHPVLAVVRGSAVNQDGASNGLTAPNGPAQERVIRAALAAAGLAATDVGAVEAHGTGTELGDPIEAQALLATYGRGRADGDPLWLGSVKSNIGHTQWAAGVAGVMKMVLALRHGELPRTLHADEPTPRVDWSTGAVRLLREPAPWNPAAGRRRRAGISSFGISGTNAHVIIEEAPEPTAEAAGTVAADAPAEAAASRALPVVPWLLSARSGEALAAQAAKLLAHVTVEHGANAPALDPVDLAWSLAATRSTFRHRAVALGADRAGLIGTLTALAEDEYQHPDLVVGSTSPGAGRVGFVFTGQGAQRRGMGRGLYEAFPVFAAAFDEVCAELDGLLGGSVAAVIEDGPIGETMWTQAGLFALEVALFRLLESWGVRPDVLAGHSIGEIAAAYVAGVWSLPDACRVVAARGRLMQELPAGGAMVAVAAGEERVAEVLGRWPGASVAAVNGPNAVVISGVGAEVSGAADELAAQGLRTRRLSVSHAFHSPLMEPMLAEFAGVVASVAYREPGLPLVSALTGAEVSGEVTDPAYWVRHVREAVRFGDAVEAMRASGVRTFLEVGPDGALTAMGVQSRAEDADEVWSAALRRDRDEPRTLVGALAEAHVRGVAVDWPALFAGTGAKTVDLPTYAFRRQRYWLAPRTDGGDPASLGQTALGHPLLGAAVQLPATGGLVLTGRLSPRAQPWLADHVVGGRVIVPGTAFVEMALRAADEAGCGLVEELVIETPLVLPERGVVHIQATVAEPDEAGRREVSVYSRSQDTESDEWTRHAAGVLAPAAGAPQDPAALTQWPPAGAQAVTELDDFYAALERGGLAYGPAFRGVTALWRRGTAIFAELELPEGVPVDGFGLHPALLDAALHPLGLDGGLTSPDGGPRIPFAWAGVRLYATDARALRVRLVPAGETGDAFSLAVADRLGAPVAEIRSLTLRALPAAAAQVDGLYRLEWVAAADTDAAADTVAVADTDGARLPRVAELGDDHEAAIADLAAAAAEGAELPDAVSFTCAGDGADPVASAYDATARVLALVQCWLAEDALAGVRLVVVTRGAVAAGAAARGRVDPGLAAVWGLVRAAQSEHPGRLVLADLDDEPGAADALASGLGSGEPEFAVRDGRILVRRLVRGASAAGTLELPAGSAGWRLAVLERGTLDQLRLVADPESGRALGAGEVRVGLRASGVNFRDVLNTLGMYPGEAGELGLEGAGVVAEVGPGVEGLAVGDRVMGLFPGAFAPSAITDARLVARVPAGWSFAQAAASPVVFLTAYHALVELAGLGAGESVLVHAAAGGVGMAAVQLARHLGAVVFATAGRGKWPAVLGLGVDASRLASSRTLEFEDAFRTATGGRGVDVVLDSLAGEFVDASLRLAAPGGRFIEMGKTDVRDAEQVRRDHGVAYQAFDLLRLPAERIGVMLDALTPLFASGALVPLPVTCWEVRRAAEAFRFLSQARHIGKVVLTTAGGAEAEQAGTVLVTGASGGLGGLVARHLAAQGQASRLQLASRRGPGAPGAAKLAADVAASGAEAFVVSCDATERAPLAGLLGRIADLRGVVHAAGVLDDGVISALTPARLAATLRPKADAAWHLHELTADADLRSFVMFSSVAGVWGLAGQGNYAAANAFLDALAEHRRRLGLPATSVAWGPWEQAAGMAGRITVADRGRMARDGLRPLADAEGLALFDAAAASADARPVAASLDLAALRNPGAASTPSFLSGLVRGPRAAGTTRAAAAASAAAGGTSAFAARLAALPAAERAPIVLKTVLAQAAVVLGMPEPDPSAVTQSFKDLGFDSLTSVELRHRLAGATGLRLPATVVFDYPSPHALAEFLTGELLGGDGSEEQSSGAAAREAVDGDDPLVIVGMACRFPGGASSPEGLWDLVVRGVDTVGRFPEDRGWDPAVYDPDPAATGKSYARTGAFLYDAAGFDARFFGISPREALAMDPQQRLLLEASWEALERAGIDPASLRGTDTGVFAGLIYHDYGVGASLAAEADGYLATGGSGGVASGRVSYVLGLEGPAVTVDTACSSSLVALHLAGQALRSGECDLALAGGVTVMATPGTFVDFSRQRGLSADGRCKAYAAGADGTGWGEGVGVLVLERASDAARNGHRVLAVVKGTAINQDGASNGLTAPNGPSQQRVIRAALANAGLSAGDVDAVEGHGTGTRLGDPIEAQALLATYGRGRADGDPLWLGSVKSNIGHTQAAAGVAGVIKMVEAMRHGVLPRTLHVDAPSPHIDWTAGNVRLLTEEVAWPETGRPRRAGVSSFGFGGTNAHVILEQAPEAAATAEIEPAGTPETAHVLTGDTETAAAPWILSARTETALRGQAERLRELALARPESDARDVAWSLATSRSVFEHRAVVVGEKPLGLNAVTAGQPGAGVVTGSVSPAGLGRTVFVFPGQGAQWVGMGRELMQASPVFAARMGECAAALSGFVDWSLHEVLDDAEALEAVDVVQPVLWAVMVSLAELWRAAGVVPDAVIGHSQGEIAAAVVAGGLSLEDGARVVALRSRAIRALAGRGGMVSIAESVDAVRARIERFGDRVSVAVVNSLEATVVSGEVAALEELVAGCEAEGVRVRRLPVDYASHSAQVEEIRGEILSLLAPVSPNALQVPMLSAMSSQWLEASDLGAGYWFASLRATVEFDRAVRALADAGHGVFLEMSPHPVLTGPVGATLEDAGVVAPVVVGSLRRDEGGTDRVLTSFAEVWVRGVPVDWAAVIGSGERVDLPTYAFEHERYWPKPAAPGALGGSGHPLLPGSVRLASGAGLVMTGMLSLRTHPWLADHAVDATVLLPGTALVEMAIHAAHAAGCARLDELTLEAPLALTDAMVEVQVVIGADTDGGVRKVEIHSRHSRHSRPWAVGGGAADDVAWTRHAAGTVSTAARPAGTDVDADELAAWPPRDATPVDLESWYEQMRTQAGYVYGPVFQGLRAAWRRGEDVFAEVALPESVAAEAAAFGLHPALLDAALHASRLLRAASAPDDDEVLLPFAWTGVSLHASGADALRVKLSASGGPAGGGLSLVAADGSGLAVFAADAVVLRPISRGKLLGAAAQALPESLYTVSWTPVPAAPEAAPAPRAVVLGPCDDADRLVVGLTRYADLSALTLAVEQGDEPVPDLVVAMLTPTSATPSGESLTRLTARVLDLLQEWSNTDALARARLVLVTRGAVSTAAGEDVADLAAAAFRGLVRTAQSENPDRFLLLDLPASGGSADPNTIINALAQIEEPELAERAGVLLAPRLTRPAVGLSTPAGDVPWRVEVATPGTFEGGLAIVEHSAAAAGLEPGQVRVAVRAAGVNFRDVVLTLGLVPLERDPRGGLIGSEIAGVVTEVGPGEASGLAVGDRVMGLADGGFGPVAAVDARTLVPIPDGWSYAQAAAVPVAFTTAWFGLVDLANAEPGQRVLIHAATGGVGTAAVAIARHLGLEVFATASPAKWGALTALGIDEAHIASSRDASFEEKFSGGVDLVLNALAGELTDASLRLLRDGGAFIEMGKTDIRDADAVARAHPGVRYRAFSTYEAGPDRIGAMLREVSALIDAGTVHRMPVRCWDVRHAVEALRFMSQARHIGKIVLTLPAPPARPSGTVLVTGGTGMIGGRVARHLAETGRAARTVLISRSGPGAAGAASLAAALAGAGAAVDVVSCDAAEPVALAALLARTPVTSVFHAAGVLDDAVLSSLTAERLETVMRPKADAARTLHGLTAEAGLDLDAFVLFSSAAATFGSPGQGNYAAANAYLDGLAAHRRALGLPATSLAWGLWADASGMTGHLDGGDRGRLGRDGVGALATDDGLTLLDAALARGEALLVPAELDVRGMRAAASRGERVPALWRALTSGGQVRPAATAASMRKARGESGGFARQIAALAPAEQGRALLDLVLAHVAAVLGLDGSAGLRADRAFREIGFDSLTAVELRNRLNAATGLRLTPTLVFDYPTPAALVEHVRTALVGDDADAAQSTESGSSAVATVAGSATAEPIAIVAMGCRLPGGVRGPDDFWDLLAQGRDVVGAFPRDRGWDVEELYDPDPNRAGRSYVREGAFVDGVGDFDAGFFGISPREALAMDPQQRLLLEVTWETIERAGIDPAALRGSQTGVFVGAATSGYGTGLPDESSVEGYLLTGTAASVVSGRVAYSFGLEGPAVTVETACSSSLVALHLAGQALRSGECTLALAGGATVVAVPDLVIEFSRQRGLAPDGRSKAFSESADGMGIGEGVGMVVLERLSDARRHGHRVLAVLRGSAVNQDGASNGLTAPNGPSQQRVIRAALANAQVSADDVDVVEAHGTGTSLGDPIEAQALMATYGRDRPAGRPLWLGSVKSNIAHTQWTAGIAGVMKMVLALQHGELPRTLHVQEPSSHIDWSAGNVRLLSESVVWPSGEGRVRRAGVSSFGISGTNAHVIIEEAPSVEPASQDAVERLAPVVSGGVAAWVVSGQSDAALRGQAGRLREFVVARPGLDAGDVAWSLATSRSVFEHRAVVVGQGPAGLAAVATGQPGAGVVTGTASAAGRTVFVFPGQGAQWVGMGRELMQASPVFAARMGECAAALSGFVDWSLHEVLDDAEALEAVDVVQPVLWAVMVSLAELWRAAGVVPDAVVGHSQGEIAAAVVAGGLSLEDGARVVALRSRAIRALAGRGGMVSVAESVEAVRARIGRFGDRVSVAVVNSLEATVVSGEVAALEELVAGCEAEGVRVRRLPVDYASHGAQVEQIRGEILSLLAPVSPNALQVPMLSAMSGRWLEASDLGAGYWFASLRATVEFDRAVRALADAGHGVFLEMSPHPVLTGPVGATLEDVGVAAPVVVGSLRRDEGGVGRVLTSFAEAWVRGVPVDWAAVIGSGERVDLPTYAFQHQHYWPRPATGLRDAAAAGLGSLGHPLLAASVELASGGGLIVTGAISLRTQPWLADHAVGGTVLLPGTAFVEMAIRAGRAAGSARLDELTLQAPLVLTRTGTVRIQVVVGPDEDGVRSIEVHSRPSGADDDPAAATWTRHAVGTVCAAPPAARADDLVVWPPRDAQAIAVDDDWYERLADDGYAYGPAFRGLRAVWRRGAEVYAEIALPEAAAAGAAGFGLHPALLDAALHACGLVLPPAGPGEVRLPFAWAGVSLHAAGASVLRVRIAPGQGEGAGDAGLCLIAADGTGNPVITVDSLTLRPIAAGGLSAGTTVRDGLFGVEWTRIAPGAQPETVALATLGRRWPIPLPSEVSQATYSDLDALLAAVGAGAPLPEFVLAQAAGEAAPDPAHVAGSARRTASDVLGLVQAWLAAEALETSRLVLVTRGAVATGPGEGVADLAGAAVWGLVRTAQSENPDRFVLIDLPAAGGDGGELLAHALASGEPELAVRGETILARRLTRPTGGLVPPGYGAADGAPWRIEVVRPGTLEGLGMVAYPPAAAGLDAGQVRIAVRAAGVNFRDVLIALGMYPGSALLGSEIAGVVVEAGPGVSGLEVGDRVLGIAAGGFGSLVVGDARTVVRMPRGWSFAQAAAVPIAFTTAWYGLVDLANAAPGQRVLIHAATGGVGTAAVGIARHLGLEVFATASPAKWGALKTMGFDDAHIASSRDGAFEEKFAGGVDIVINALANELTDASLRLLRNGGVFVEMGKTDLRDAAEIAELYPGVRYRPFETGEAGPDRIGEMLGRDIMPLLSAGGLQAPPVRCWDVRRAVEALRFMSQARHVGKLVLTVPASARADGTVLVTGGTGMIGGRVARHLAESGRAGRLVLASRSGPAAEGVPALVAQLARAGADSSIVSCDAADRGALAGLLAATPVTSVFHSTGVLDDGVITALNPDRVDTVMRPKVDAAWNLHELTAGLDLDAFVLFSSAAATFGGAGQGNYASANAFLDALAARRRSTGLPGTSLAWGLWADASGMTGHLATGDRSRIGRGGIAEMSADEGLTLLDAALARDESLLVPALLDVSGVRAAAARGEQVPAIWRGLAAASRGARALPGPSSPAADGANGAATLADRLSALTTAEQDRVLQDLVRGHVAAVLGHASAESVRLDLTFRESGFDSLTAVELRNRLNASAGLRLPSTLVFDYPTPAALAAHLRARLAPQASATGYAPALKELDRLEAVLAAAGGAGAGAGAGAGDESLPTLVARLEALVQGLRGPGTGTTAKHLAAPPAAPLQELDDATDEEMFDLIDNLGIENPPE